MILKDELHEIITGIQDGIEAFNEAQPNMVALMPSEIEFDVNVNEATNIKFQINITDDNEETDI